MYLKLHKTEELVKQFGMGLNYKKKATFLKNVANYFIKILI